MAALSSFYPLVLVELPACPAPTVDNALREAAREVCCDAGVWRASLAPIDVVAGTAAYALATPAGSEVTKVASLTLGGRLLWRDADAVATAQSSERPEYRRDDPPFVLSADLTALELLGTEIPTATVAGALNVAVTLQPTATAAELPDFLLSRYRDLMRVAVLGRLLAMGGVPWTDRPLAAAYRTEYQQLIAYAAYQGAVGSTGRALRVRKWR